MNLRALFPAAKPGWLEALETHMTPAGIDTPREIASFLCQLYQESKGLTTFEENLYYITPDLLVKTWKKRFAMPDIHGIVPDGKANPYEYVRVPEKLANFVYANRMGNGPPESGDGWRHRGMGPIQLTGKNNQGMCGDDIGFDFRARPQLLLMPVPGIKSATWFWMMRGLDKLDDDDDVRAETLTVNGGEHGLDKRQEFFDKAMAMLTDNRGVA